MAVTQRIDPGEQRTASQNMGCPGHPVQHWLTGRRIFLLGVALLLLECTFRYLHTWPLPWWPTRKWFDLNLEGTIPVWFSSTQLLIVALVASYCVWRERLSKSGSGVGWLPVIGLFLYISLDETAQLHEPIGRWLGHMISIEIIKGGAVFYWLVAFLPAIGISVAYLTIFFWRKFRTRPRVLTLVFVGLLSWVGALGCEAAQGLYSLEGSTARHVVGWEEFLEMAGATFFLLAFLQYGMVLAHGQGRRDNSKVAEL